MESGSYLRVPYPLGFYTKWMDGRIDDPRAGWKGKALWATVSTRAPFHGEGGKGATSQVLKLQMRPSPLAKSGEPTADGAGAEGHRRNRGDLGDIHDLAGPAPPEHRTLSLAGERRCARHHDDRRMVVTSHWDHSRSCSVALKERGRLAGIGLFAFGTLYYAAGLMWLRSPEAPTAQIVIAIAAYALPAILLSLPAARRACN